ncbi:nuclear transport factor 2 family protein [Streptomyces ficellus]|uniref:Nuclear transport factor 2 family protein n=1 Tax=Streptomyces ficellus TaxID=1977088 RepID=A0A6I6FPU6_9ACTN|nr:nuclear transport factor 2 family protein [Streptomyces ficellus]QGV78566.1 nuclear transport factor 2 family protein [Streptomyces ficellus]
MRKRLIPPVVLTAALLLGTTACSDGGGDGANGAAARATPSDTVSKVQESPAGSPSAPAPAAADADAVDPAAQAYVDAVAAEDLDALVAAFHPDAELTDVGRQFSGHDEIRRWADNEVIGGRLTVLKNTPKSNGTTLLVRFAPGGSGGFEANYEFDVRDGRIAKLNLQYA